MFQVRRTEAATATATGRLNKLIQQEGRKTLKIKTAVGKPYQQIIQLALQAQIDMKVMGVRGRSCVGSCGVWFDHLSRTAVGTVPRARCAPMNR